MAYELNTVPPLESKDTAVMVDLLQKMEALDAALADVQTDRATHEADWNKKTNLLNQEKSNVKDAIRAIRAVTIKEV